MMMEFPGNCELKEFNRLYKRIDELYHEIALHMGISDSAFIVLYFICEMGEGCLQRDICNASFLSKQTIHSTIRKLQKDGILTLKQGRGRDMHILLTEQGRQFVEKEIFLVVQAETAALEDMQSQGSELVRLTEMYLKKLRENTVQLRLPEN